MSPKFIYILLLIALLCVPNYTVGQTPSQNIALKNKKKKVKALEKEYKKALKHHKKIQSGGRVKATRKSSRVSKRLRDNRKGLRLKRIKGGSHRKGMRKVKNHKRMKIFKNSSSRFLRKIGGGFKKVGKGIGSGIGKIGNGIGKIKLPKIKRPRLFNRN